MTIDSIEIKQACNFVDGEHSREGDKHTCQISRNREVIIDNHKDRAYTETEASEHIIREPDIAYVGDEALHIKGEGGQASIKKPEATSLQSEEELGLVWQDTVQKRNSHSK